MSGAMSSAASFARRREVAEDPAGDARRRRSTRPNRAARPARPGRGRWPPRRGAPSRWPGREALERLAPGVAQGRHDGLQERGPGRIGDGRVERGVDRGDRAAEGGGLPVGDAGRLVLGVVVARLDRRPGRPPDRPRSRASLGYVSVRGATTSARAIWPTWRPSPLGTMSTAKIAVRTRTRRPAATRNRPRVAAGERGGRARGAGSACSRRPSRPRGSRRGRPGRPPRAPGRRARSRACRRPGRGSAATASP